MYSFQNIQKLFKERYFNFHKNLICKNTGQCVQCDKNIFTLYIEEKSITYNLNYKTRNGNFIRLDVSPRLCDLSVIFKILNKDILPDDHNTLKVWMNKYMRCLLLYISQIVTEKRGSYYFKEVSLQPFMHRGFSSNEPYCIATYHVQF